METLGWWGQRGVAVVAAGDGVGQRGRAPAASLPQKAALCRFPAGRGGLGSHRGGFVPLAKASPLGSPAAIPCQGLVSQPRAFLLRLPALTCP